jgi:outer membrane protein TolC
MTMHSFKFPKTGLLILLSLMALSSQAQEARRLTLEEAIDLGMKNSKALKMTQAKATVADAKYKQQFSSSLPSINLTSQYQHLSTNIQEYKFGGQTIAATIHDQFLNTASISQVIFAGLRGLNTLKATKEQVQAAQFDLAADKATTRNNIVTAYYNHYKLIESKKVVDENLKVVQQRLKDAQNLQSVGMALKNDVLKVQLSMANLQQTAADVQSAVDVSNYNLDIMLGLPDTTKIEIADAGLLSPKADFDINGGMQTALKKRPEIKAAAIRLDASQKLVKVTKGLYSPVISAGFNYYYSKPNQRVFIEDQIRFHDSWDIGVRLTWNITNLFTNQFQTKEAKANLQQTQASQQMLNENIRMEVNANYAAYKLAVDKIALSEQSIAQAIENRKMTKDQYDNGIKNITDMLDADNLVTTSEINLLNAKIDAEIAYAKLLKATAN